MAHTFVGESNGDVKRRVRAPLCHYLRSYFNQFENFGFDADNVTEDDKNIIVEKAFEHYFDSSSLMGTRNKCARLVDRLIEAGVDEIACLVDFGLDADSVLGSLRGLNDLRSHYDHSVCASESDMSA
jgi:alkanesulfonate monooxygenase SsuD/methylene tetrahydromethanopterin reductase-like flavin-dependent oxidoreductase (luciferase family)